METDYADAVETYLRERGAADAEMRAADNAYRAETAALADAVADARARRDQANRAAVEASTLVAETDKTVAVMWRALGGFVGHRRTGPTPHAGRVEYVDATAASIRARLQRADRLLRLARQGELPIDAPRHTEATAAGIGATVGALAVAAAAWILSGEAGGALPGAFAAATLFLGIAAAPVALGAWLSWQYRVRPRPAQTISAVAAAVAAVCALAGVFLRGM